MGVQIFTLLSRFIQALPEEDTAKILTLGGNPSFPLLFGGMLARMTHLRDYFKNPTTLDNILGVFTPILKTIIKVSSSRSNGNTLPRQSGLFLLGCMCNALLCLAFWGTPSFLTEKVAFTLTTMKQAMKHSKPYNFQEMLRQSLGSNLWTAIHPECPNMLNPVA